MGGQEFWGTCRLHSCPNILPIPILLNVSRLPSSHGSILAMVVERGEGSLLLIFSRHMLCARLEVCILQMGLQKYKRHRPCFI